MSISRRNFNRVVAVAAAAAATGGLTRTGIAQDEPLRLGWFAALTGPSSAPAIGIGRGVAFGVQAINDAGGVKGRKIELVVRDTQGDPTKAVNAAQELISQARVHAVCGPTNSGETLAVSAIMARAKMPHMFATVLDSLIDPRRMPNAFRVAPSNTQWDAAVRNYTLNVLKAKKVAVVADTTGYGVSAAKASADAIKNDGGDVVQIANIDATQTDMTPDLLRLRDSGAEAIVAWTTSTGMIARLLNARAQIEWDVPFIGHPALSSGDIAGLLEKPQNWANVFCVGYRSCSYDNNGKLPERTQELVDRLQGKVSLDDSLLWWVASGIDSVNLFAKAVEETGSTDSADIIEYLNTVRDFPGYFGNFTFTPEEHNGYPTAEVVMSAANTGRNGAFDLAPGYN